jgi:hypothetical protein
MGCGRHRQADTTEAFQTPAKKDKSFLLLFFKKEALAFYPSHPLNPGCPLLPIAIIEFFGKLFPPSRNKPASPSGMP